MLESYFDESARGDSLLIVGGVVSTPTKWLKFSERCEQIKQEFSIPYVHSVKLFAQASTGLYGHLTMKRRREVADALAHAIGDFAEFSLVISVRPDQYNQLTTKQWRDRNASPYAACFGWILVCLQEILCGLDNAEQTVNIFIEGGHTNVGGAEEVIRDYKKFTDSDPVTPVVRATNLPLKIGDYGVLSKQTAAPLWAADMIAYGIQRQIVRRDRYFTELFQEIEKRVPCVGMFIDETIVEYMKRMAVDAQAVQKQWQADIHQTVKKLNKFGGKAARDKRGVLFDFSYMTAKQRDAFLHSLIRQ